MKNSVVRFGNITIVGLKAISRNKMRSFLTMLGIVIGVGCVIIVVAIGNGASKSIQDTINALGSNFIMIIPGATSQSGASARTLRWRRSASLTAPTIDPESSPAASSSGSRSRGPS